ncbi:zinc finger protein CONSTANS-LIKE 2-like [Impatiens glandulifera]|uniref:zinc finger protein CONSTANS-LIKE 2-like n=1 Tax=Impatiens glandulifera TaxID=253017 RepID=UPI001FB182F4|nr:zinc finger protein CONSTANS-LIKE 2-like [Impatiens glandulifera]
MLKEENTLTDVGNSWARVCDTCRSAPSTVYCRVDSAYLCTGCDARIHAANRLASRHERVFVCEACERAPAAFLCKADSASLCATCDASIHSANPLASRHHRVPVLPIPGCLYGPPATRRPCGSDIEISGDCHESLADEDDGESASWLLLNQPTKNNNLNGNGFMFGGEPVDEYLDLDEYNLCQENQFSEQYNSVPQGKYYGDSIVPVQGFEVEAKGHHQQQQQNYPSSMDYDTPKIGYGYPASSLSHSISVSSVEVGVVPESTLSDSSISHARHSKGTIEFFSGPPVQIPQQLTPMDREARVLRYREKKKARKFEKTIRYASRKAYAETRPRIKGRFAKRSDVEIEVDQMFSTSMVVEGLVPSF